MPRNNFHYQKLFEQVYGMTPAEFVFDYVRRSESRTAVAARTGIPYTTLRTWERRYLKKRNMVEVTMTVPAGAKR